MTTPPLAATPPLDTTVNDTLKNIKGALLNDQEDDASLSCLVPALAALVSDEDGKDGKPGLIISDKDAAARDLLLLDASTAAPSSNGSESGDMEKLGGLDELIKELKDRESHQAQEQKTEEATSGAPRNSIDRALSNYKAVTGEDTTEAKLIESGELVKWSMHGMTSACQGNAALAKRMKRKMEGNNYATWIFNGLKDMQKNNFTLHFGTFETFDFVKTRKTYNVVHVKNTQQRGELVTIYELGNRYGGWHLLPCRMGAINYVKAALKHAPELVCLNKWSKMVEIRYFVHLTISSTSEEWRKEVEELREDSTNEFVLAARTNRAKRAFIWQNWSPTVKEPTDEELQKTLDGVRGWSNLLDQLPQEAHNITLPFNIKNHGKKDIALTFPKGGKGKGKGNDDTSTPKPLKDKVVPKAPEPFVELKQLMGTYAFAKSAVEGYKEEANANKEAWATAQATVDSGVDAYEQLEAKISGSDKSRFHRKFKDSLINAREMTKLKKGPDFAISVGTFLEIYREKVPNVDFAPNLAP